MITRTSDLWGLAILAVMLLFVFSVPRARAADLGRPVPKLSVSIVVSCDVLPGPQPAPQVPGPLPAAIVLPALTAPGPVPSPAAVFRIEAEACPDGKCSPQSSNSGFQRRFFFRR